MNAQGKPWSRYQPQRMGPLNGRGTPVTRSEQPVSYEPIPASRYTSPEFMRLEWERMWRRTWLMTVRESEIRNAGDYATYELGKESFLITRDQNGRARAYYNVCLHRGNRLRPVGAERQCGHAASFACSYHAWEWNLDGTVKNIPEYDVSFPRIEPKSALSLREVRADVWGGWVWINMNPHAEPLLEFLDPIPQHFKPYQMEDYVVAANLTIEWDCNWKTSVDAFNESYHVQGIHPQLFDYIDDLNLQFDTYRRHARMLVPQCIPSPRAVGRERLHHYTETFLKAFGKDLDYFRAHPREARDAVIRAKRAVENESHFPYRFLSDEQLTDDYHYTIFPNAQFNTYGEGAMVFVSRPHATDPNKMYWDLLYYTHPDTRAAAVAGGAPENAANKVVTNDGLDIGDPFLNEILLQDAFNLPHVQKGMQSDACDVLRVSEQEIRIAFFHQVLMQQYIERP